ncbi:hypothetical protein [Cystobacter fuscus]|uniref:hypothetical protein n=1 Tax=Cystobacter fuscus TaxID=43 RepID=UPI002B2C2416|nr:hypothetical protein F0U63_23950 [Cystobacter fuscus]
MTPTESALVGRLKSIRNERNEMLARLDSMERELTAELHAANVAADAGERLLLTEQSELLVGAVASAFREFGFQVQDMDAVWPVNDRREDLRLGLSERGDWLSICEVKGYCKSAKSSDLLKIERFRGRFFKELGRDPNRCLYVVNSFVNDAPSSRKKPLHSNPDEVEAFAEDGGLVVGTVELFRLLMDVRRGRVDVQTARSLLADSTGVFSWNPNDEENVK